MKQKQHKKKKTEVNHDDSKVLFRQFKKKKNGA